MRDDNTYPEDRDPLDELDSTITEDERGPTMADEQEALQIFDSRPAQLMVSRPPEIVLEEAMKAARALKTVIDGKARKVIFNGEQYLEYEDWQTVGRFYGITVKVMNVAFVEYGAIKGFSARAVALRSDGAEISAAEAECLTDEEKWSTRPKYEWRETNGKRERIKIGEEHVPLFQLKSMAQTRACAKALRNVLAWVVVLAGYRPTPSEEVDVKVEQKVKTSRAIHKTGDPVFVANIDPKTKKDGTTYYVVTLSDGRSGSAFDGAIASEAERFYQEKIAVEPTFTTKGQWTNLVNLVAARTTARAIPLATAIPARPEKNAVYTVTHVVPMTTGGFGIETAELGPNQFVQTSDRELARAALKSKIDGEQVEMLFTKKTVITEQGVNTEQRSLVELTVVHTPTVAPAHDELELS